MNSIELLKQLRTLAGQNGDSMSLKTAQSIVNYLLEIGCLDKNPGSYGDFIIKTGHPQVK